jgi:hypothetical protein
MTASNTKPETDTYVSGGDQDQGAKPDTSPTPR